MELAEKLKKFDLPPLRLDISKPENVRWLNRNIFIRNSTNPELPAVQAALRGLLKGRD